MDKVPAMARRRGADTYPARWRRSAAPGAHRAAQVRGRLLPRATAPTGSPWPGLLLTVPVITCTTLINPVWCSPDRPGPADRRRRPAAAARQPAESVRDRGRGPDRGVRRRSARTRRGPPGSPRAPSWSSRPAASSGCSSPSSGPGSACRGGAAARCSSTCANASGCRARCPGCPEGWHREMALRPAGGQSFSGDFVVAARTNGGRTLEVVLTDVSGKGMDAGSRALLLSGAFGGLLGSLPPARLPARGQRLSAAPGLGRGLRHLHPSRPRPGLRRLRAPLGRPSPGASSCTRAAAGGRRRPPRARCSASTTGRSSTR